MKAEIGFVMGYDEKLGYQLTDKLHMVVTPSSSTEVTLLRMFAKRMGVRAVFDESSAQIVMVEP